VIERESAFIIASDDSRKAIMSSEEIQNMGFIHIVELLHT